MQFAANLSLLRDPDLKVRMSTYMLLQTYSMWSYDDVAKANALAWFMARKIPQIIANYGVKVRRYQSMVTKQYRLRVYVNRNKEQVLDEHIVHLSEPHAGCESPRRTRCTKNHRAYQNPCCPDLNVVNGN